MTQELQEQKKELEWYDRLNLLSLEHLREFIREQWDCEASDNDLIEITEKIMEKIDWFLYDVTRPVLNNKA